MFSEHIGESIEIHFVPCGIFLNKFLVTHCKYTLPVNALLPPCLRHGRKRPLLHRMEEFARIRMKKDFVHDLILAVFHHININDINPCMRCKGRLLCARYL